MLEATQDNRFENLSTPDSPLQKWINPIVEYAATAGIDQAWFLDKARRLMSSSFYVLKNGFSQEELSLLSDPQAPPRHHWEFYELALESLSRGDRDQVRLRLRLAENAAEQKEEGNEYIIYQWGYENLFSILDDLKKHEPYDVEVSFDQMKANLRIDKYRGLLQSRNEFFEEEAQAQEKQQIGSIESSYNQKIKSLQDEIDRLKKGLDDEKTKLTEPRVKSEQALLDSLQRIITIERHQKSEIFSYIGHETYRDFRKFGFEEADVILMLNYALDKWVDPEIFLRHCEATRVGMEHVWGSNWNRKNKSDDKGPNIFSEEGTEQEIPALEAVEEQCRLGIKTLKPYFIHHRLDHKLAIEEARPYFAKAKNLLDAIDDPKRSISYFQATSLFFEFMMSEQAKVFVEPTARKFHFEEFSYKEK